STQTQTLTVSPSALIDFDFNGHITSFLGAGSTIPIDADNIQSALMGLPGIGDAGGTVTVTQGNGTFTIAFGGTLTHADLPLLSVAVVQGPQAGVAASGTPVISGQEVDLSAAQMTINAGITATTGIALDPGSPAPVTLGDGVAGASFALGSAELALLDAPVLS